MMCQSLRRSNQLPALHNQRNERMDTKGFRKVDMAIPFLVDMVTKDKVFPANSIGSTTTIVPLSISVKYGHSDRQSMLTEISETKNADSEASEVGKCDSSSNIHQKTAIRNKYRSGFSRTRTVVRSETGQEHNPTQQRTFRRQKTIKQHSRQEEEQENIKTTDRFKSNQRTMTQQGRQRPKLKQLQKHPSGKQPIVQQVLENPPVSLTPAKISKLSTIKMTNKGDSKQGSVSSRQSSKHSSISNRTPDNKIQRNHSVFMEQATKILQLPKEVQILEELQEVQEVSRLNNQYVAIQANKSALSQPSKAQTLSLLTTSSKQHPPEQNFTINMVPHSKRISQSLNPSLKNLARCPDNINAIETANQLEGNQSKEALSMLTFSQSNSRKSLGVDKNQQIAQSKKVENPYKTERRQSGESRGSFDYSLLVLNHQTKMDEIRQDNPIYRLLNCLHRQINMTKIKQMDKIKVIQKPIVRINKKKIDEEPEQQKNTMKEYVELRQARKEYFAAETKFISLVREVCRGFQHLKQK